jgi:hypothetical protein
MVRELTGLSNREIAPTTTSLSPSNSCGISVKTLKKVSWTWTPIVPIVSDASGPAIK